MKRKALVYTIFPVYFVIIILSLVLVVFFTVSRFRDFHLKQTAQAKFSEIDLVSDKVASIVKRQDEAQLQRSVNHWAKVVGARMTVIALDGRVLADSEVSPKKLDNHADRSEFVVALSKGMATSKRKSRSTDHNLFYVAKRVDEESQPVAVVRLAVPLLTLEETFNQTRHEVMLVFLGVITIAGGLSLFVAKRIISPFTKLKNTAQAFAQGDLSHRMTVEEGDEVSVLANSMNSMAENLETQMTALTRERNETDAILHSMIEGVLALDPDEKILSFNQATLNLFGIKNPMILGKTLHEVFRHPELLSFVNKLLQAHSAFETELMIDTLGRERCVRSQGTVLKDAKGKTFGVLVVFHDVTRLRELEGMRKNFVANVSHELKTPLTAIQGFVETLQDGAVEDPKQAKEFLKIISSHTERLSQTIHDLLQLSQIERETDSGQVEFQDVDICSVVYSAMEICQIKAQQKNIRIVCEATQSHMLNLNVRLMEQAIINLVDNAIRYSALGSEVLIQVRIHPEETVVSVQDFGPGIEKKHLERIFERFYRVDEARSRDLGGNGLGLAIVKHIVQAHKGSVSVHSEVGKGSVFSIHIPHLT